MNPVAEISGCSSKFLDSLNNPSFIWTTLQKTDGLKRVIYNEIRAEKPFLDNFQTSMHSHMLLLSLDCAIRECTKEMVISKAAEI